MPYPTLPRAVLGAVFALCLQIAPAQAQLNRYVATFGNDANNCTHQGLACLTLQRAQDVAPPGSKIIVLDSGDFGTVTITKSIAIVATGVHAKVDNGFGDKIFINAGPNDVVYLEGLAMGENSPAAAKSGIQFNSGGRLHVRNCTIRNFGTAGILVRGGGAKRVFISDCTIANNLHGVFVRPAGTGRSRVQLDRVRIEGNLGNGIRAVGSGAIVRVSNSTIANNNRGLAALNNGKIVSFGNNAIIDNNVNGAPTSTITLE